MQMMLCLHVLELLDGGRSPERPKGEPFGSAVDFLSGHERVVENLTIESA